MIAPGPLRLLNHTLAEAAENVALDEHLLRDTEENDRLPVLRLWESPGHAVIVGRSNRLARNVNVAACRADGVPIVRRTSGGGTVLLGPGVLVYSLILRIDSGDRLVDIEGATRLILERIRAALSRRLAGIEMAGVSDLALETVKFSGNAQRWLRRTMLHHGTLLYNCDIGRIERYLTSPERAPEYRRGRDHRSFVRNLPLSRETLVAALVEAWEARLPMGCPALGPVREAVRERFGREEWTFKR